MNIDKKSMGLLSLLTKGLINCANQETVLHLGDRRTYIGMSDIGKGMECLRAAVGSKIRAPSSHSSLEVDRLKPSKLKEILARQLILQRGHWQEFGVQKALAATGVKFLPQLEINTLYKGVPIKAHLDFTLVWGGGRPAVRIIELKSNQRIPDLLYTSNEAQIYGQIGLLTAFWHLPNFNMKSETGETVFTDLTFPQAVHKIFGVILPETPDAVDIEGWVVAISMSDVKTFGPYKPENSMLTACLNTAVKIWNGKQAVESGKTHFNDLEFCQGFHPLCDWCEMNRDCQKFNGQGMTELNPIYGDELEGLASLKEQRDKIENEIKEIENRVKFVYRLLDTNSCGNWVNTDKYRFRVSTVAGRKTLDRITLERELTACLKDETEGQTILQRAEKSGNPYDRLFIGKINQPVQSAA
ncbi:MAG: hypothetical protein PHP23_05685 [Desulfobacterales bacterium]|nr:hypothetical protein [Desulfobacterales bacterium]MDD4072642.1 hypothetical protein [Desulfobacterales bacterium]MDD4391462.1 hypothetical protein [Desulfobacterales bacterium]